MRLLYLHAINSVGFAQGAHTASELALQLRKLDSYIQWEALKRPALDPDSPLATAEILQRRPGAAPNTGWDYLVQMAPVEPLTAVGLGSNLGIRQPLQPLTAVAQQPHQQQQQQLMSKQALPQLPGQFPAPLQQLSGQSPAPLQQLQEAEQRQRQSVQIPNSALSVLPNHVTVQQRQQAYGAEQDKQIAVQQAVSSLSDLELNQLPAIAESAGRPAESAHGPAESAVPSQPHAHSCGLTSDSPPAGATGVGDKAGAVYSESSLLNGASQLPQLDKVPAQLRTAAQTDPLLQVSLSSAASNGNVNQHVHGEETAVAKLSQHSETRVEPEGAAAPQHPSPTPPGAPHPSSAAPTPFLTQQPPQQGSLLLSLVPDKQHPSTLEASSAQAAQFSGASGRALGQGAEAGPSSREGTPAPKGPAAWLHESQLPLWLVKAYEEKRRRDVSMVAARAAQQAQRDANAASRGFGHLSQPWRSEGTPTHSPTHPPTPPCA